MPVPIKFSSLKGLTDLQLMKHLMDYTQAINSTFPLMTMMHYAVDTYLQSIYAEIESRVTRSLSDRNRPKEGGEKMSKVTDHMSENDDVKRHNQSAEWVTHEEALEHEVILLTTALEEACDYMGREFPVPIWVETNNKAYVRYFKGIAKLKMDLKKVDE